jgi:hypothetical protein
MMNRSTKDFVMRARIISLVLIAAVIACPLSCGQGVCCDSHSCADDDRAAAGRCSETAPAKPAASNCGCCDKSPDEGDQPDPQPCPDKSSCQGVCGGAVFEKTCELNSADVTSVLSLYDSDSTSDSPHSVYRTDRFSVLKSVRAGNYGRFVRTLHMSLTC